MKKFILASLIAIAPVIATAQIELVSGYNFGQFLFAGDAATDGSTFFDSGYIGANWAEGAPAPGTSSGDQNFSGPGYENGTGRLYWDGTAGSTNNLGTGVVTAVQNFAFSINAFTQTGANMALLGDNTNNNALIVNSATTIAFVQDTLGFSEAGVLDLTFAASAVSAPITIDWQFGGNIVATTNVGTAWAVYSVDLPSSFYGSAASELQAIFSGAGQLDNLQFNTAIPEPSTYAVILGALTVGFVNVRRRRSATLA